MHQPDKFDVIIIGGGPAGSCAALRLLSLGHHVALVEKERFPRDQIGESLSPGVWNIFNYLKADHLLEKPACLHDLPARVIWETKTAKIVGSQHRGPGVIVNRGKLDTGLIELAIARGLHLFQPAKFESCRKTGEHLQAVIKHNNVEKVLTGTFILDARGRQGTSASNRILTAPPAMALWTHIAAAAMPPETTVEALEHGWLWGSPIPNNQFRIMALVEPEELKRKQPKNVLNDLLSQGELFSSVNDVLASDVQACSVLMYFHANPWEDNYVRLGESGFSLDPLSSTGVEKAMRFSLQAAIAVNTVLKRGNNEISKSFYEERMMETIVTHTMWTKDYYAKAWPGVAYPFWKDRSMLLLKYNESQSSFYNRLVARSGNTKALSEEVTEKSLVVESILGLWNERIKVSPELTYVETACVVDDYLELKTAIKHPRLERAIAYLDQIEIAPLLKRVRPSQTFGEIVNQWSSYIPLKKAMDIAIFLWNAEIICL